jgi:hypothetical protein
LEGCGEAEASLLGEGVLGYAISKEDELFIWSRLPLSAAVFQCHPLSSKTHHLEYPQRDVGRIAVKPSKMFASPLDISLGEIPVFRNRLSELRGLYLEISGSAADGCTTNGEETTD